MKNFIFWWWMLGSHVHERGYAWAFRYSSFVAFCFNIGSAIGTFIRQGGFWNVGLFNLGVAAVLAYIVHSTYKDIHLQLK